MKAVWLIEREHKNGEWCLVGPIFTELEQAERWLKPRPRGFFRIVVFERLGVVLVKRERGE